MICAGSCVICECTEATTMSSWARQSSGEIETAVGQDVALDAGEQSQSLEAAVERAHAGRMLECAPLIQSVGHRQRLAVIGDGDVPMAHGVRRRGHRLEVVAAVGLGRVHVQVAAQVGIRHQAAADGRARPPPISPRSSRSAGSIQRQPERGVDGFLRLTGEARVVCDRYTGRTRSASDRAGRRDRAARCCAPSSR